MGIAKTIMMRMEERGYYFAKGNVCADCFFDAYLQQFIENNATVNKCDFCGQESQKPIAIKLDDLIKIILNGIQFDWNNPDDEGIYYESREGGYQATLITTDDLFNDGKIAISENNDLVSTIVDSIGYDKCWVKKDYYAGTDDEILYNGWENFCNTVKHKSRYVFLREQEKEVYHPSRIDASDYLDALADSVAFVRLFRELSVDFSIFRVRIHESKWSKACDLGAPPSQYANQSNRMSPAGIPMFYGAVDKNTALIETSPELHPKGSIVSIGEFKPTRNLLLLDLANIPSIPSVFDGAGWHLIRELRFLHSFADDLAKTIEKDGREHIEYVPTQIVTEYFRKIYKTPDGKILDGIIYKSSKNGLNAFVLFCENHQSCDIGETQHKEHILRLVSVNHEVI